MKTQLDMQDNARMDKFKESYLLVCMYSNKVQSWVHYWDKIRSFVHCQIKYVGSCISIQVETVWDIKMPIKNQIMAFVHSWRINKMGIKIARFWLNKFSQKPLLSQSFNWTGWVKLIQCNNFTNILSSSNREY